MKENVVFACYFSGCQKFQKELSDALMGICMYESSADCAVSDWIGGRVRKTEVHAKSRVSMVDPFNAISLFF